MDNLYKPNNSMPKWFAVAVVLLLVVSCLFQNNSYDNATRSSGTPFTGDLGRVKRDTLVGFTSEAYDRAVQLSVAHDNDGLAQMVLAGQAGIASTGTKVRVIDGGVFTTEVRFLDGPMVGRSAFVSSELLSR